MGLSETQAKVVVKMKNRGLNHGLFQSPDLEVLGDVSYCCQCSVSVCVHIRPLQILSSPSFILSKGSGTHPRCCDMPGSFTHTFFKGFADIWTPA